MSVPHLLESVLTLFSQATPGVALSVAGLTIAARKMIVSLEVGVNIVLKMLAQPERWRWRWASNSPTGMKASS